MKHNLLTLSLLLITYPPLWAAPKRFNNNPKYQKKSYVEAAAKPEHKINPAITVLPPSPHSATDLTVLPSTSEQIAAFETIQKTQTEPGSLDARLGWWWGAHVRATLEKLMDELTPEVKFGTGIQGENTRFTAKGLYSYKKNAQPDKMIALIEFLNAHKNRDEMPIVDSNLVTAEYRTFIEDHIKSIGCQLEVLEPKIEMAETLRGKKAKISTILAAVAVAEQK